MGIKDDFLNIFVGKVEFIRGNLNDAQVVEMLVAFPPKGKYDWRHLAEGRTLHLKSRRAFMKIHPMSDVQSDDIGAGTTV